MTRAVPRLVHPSSGSWVILTLPVPMYLPPSCSNHGWRNIFESLGSVAPFRDESQRAEILWDSQAQPEPLGRAQRVDQDTITLRIVFDGIEQHCGRAPPLRDNIRHTADL